MSQLVLGSVGISLETGFWEGCGSPVWKMLTEQTKDFPESCWPCSIVGNWQVCVPLLESVLWHSGVLRYCVYHIVWCVCVFVNDPNVETSTSAASRWPWSWSTYCKSQNTVKYDCFVFRWFDLTVAVVHHIPVFVACVYWRHLRKTPVGGASWEVWGSR